MGDEIFLQFYSSFKSKLFVREKIGVKITFSLEERIFFIFHTKSHKGNRKENDGQKIDKVGVTQKRQNYWLMISMLFCKVLQDWLGGWAKLTEESFYEYQKLQRVKI